ncbi:unnamed protein product [Symbiodinium sp. CCMP2592]|nr:unnamed protein product [Symbiodinium sp. CCMP2592]
MALPYLSNFTKPHTSSKGETCKAGCPAKAEPSSPGPENTDGSMYDAELARAVMAINSKPASLPQLVYIGTFWASSSKQTITDNVLLELDELMKRPEPYTRIHSNTLLSEDQDKVVEAAITKAAETLGYKQSWYVHRNVSSIGDWLAKWCKHPAFHNNKRCLMPSRPVSKLRPLERTLLDVCIEEAIAFKGARRVAQGKGCGEPTRLSLHARQKALFRTLDGFAKQDFVDDSATTFVKTQVSSNAFTQDQSSKKGKGAKEKARARVTMGLLAEGKAAIKVLTAPAEESWEGVTGPRYYKPGHSGYYATTMPQPSDNADTIAPASTPSDNQDTIAPASTPSDNQDTIAPASTPGDNEDTVAPASTPSDNQDTIAPASTPGDNEDTVAPASTPIDNQDTIAPASTPGDNEDTVAPASTPVDNQDTIAPAPTSGDNEDTVAPASTPVDNQDTIVPDLPPGDNEAPAPIINVVTPAPTDVAATTNTTTLPPDATTNTTIPPVATTNTTTLPPDATTNTTLPPPNATNTTTAKPVIAAPATPDANSATEEACAANGEVCDTMNCCSAECLHTANGTFRCAQCVEGALCARCELSFCDREVECCFGLECRGGYDSSVVNSTGWCVFP